MEGPIRCHSLVAFAVRSGDARHRHPPALAVSLASNLCPLILPLRVLVAGVAPYATLFHWDLPLALHNKYGGFLSPQIV